MEGSCPNSKFYFWLYLTSKYSNNKVIKEVLLVAGRDQSFDISEFHWPKF